MTLNGESKSKIFLMNAENWQTINERLLSGILQLTQCRSEQWLHALDTIEFFTLQYLENV